MYVMKQFNNSYSKVDNNNYYCFGSSNIQSLSDYEKITKSFFDVLFKKKNKKENKILNGTDDLKCIIKYDDNNYLIIMSVCSCYVSIFVNDSYENIMNIVNVNVNPLEDLVSIINEFLL